MPHRSPPSTARRLPAVASAAIAALVVVLGSSPVPAPAEVTAERAAAMDWLVAELAAGGGSLELLGRPDWGLTTDVLLAALADGRAAEPAVADSVDAVLRQRSEYLTWDALGPGFGGVLLAGPAAKVLLVAQLAGRTAEAAELEVALRSLVGVDGRVADRNPHSPDTANLFGQAMATLALRRSDGGVAEGMIAHLLSRQCPSGGFALDLGPAPPCADGSDADTDATAVAAVALLAVERTPAVTTALVEGLGWLASRQGPDGEVGGTGPTAAPNANSTGLAAQAWRAAGWSTPADRAVGWLRRLQRPQGSIDAGAVAYDMAAVGAAADGIAPLVRDQWRRATSQAVLGFGVPILAELDQPPLEPVPQPVPSSTTTAPTSLATSTTSTTTTTTTGGSTTTTTFGAAATSTSTTTTGSTAAAAAPPSSRATPVAVLGTGASASSSERVGTEALARSGASVDPLLTLALVALVTGAGLRLVVRRRR